MNSLEQSCKDILYKNMEYTDQAVYILYDTDSPLAKILSSAFLQILPPGSRVREFKNPPQPLYRGGFVNPENPHIKEQNRVITSHNISENVQVGLDHHKKLEVTQVEVLDTDPEIEDIKNELITLPKGSIVILVQSTNFRLSTFRIRLELFHRGIHVVEFNHLAYIKDEELETFQDSLRYRTDMYKKLEISLGTRLMQARGIEIHSPSSHTLSFGPVEPIRGNTGDYTGLENKGGTFPIGEVFTESIDLSSLSGTALVEAFPNEDFSVCHTSPFEITVQNGRVLPSEHFPPAFQKIYNWIVEYEGEVIVRELGLGINPAITASTPLSDINFYERKTGVHLSLGKKHGIYGKKLPKSEVQRFHIDVFLSVSDFQIDKESVFDGSRWTLL